MNRKVLQSISVAFVLFLTACAAPVTVPLAAPTPTSPPLSPAAAAGTLDPCSLVLLTELESVLGERVTANPFREPVDRGMLCGYFIGNRSIVITFKPVESTAIESLIAEWRAESPGAQEWAGLGDRALFSFQENVPNSNAKAGSLYLVKKNIVLVISLADPNLSQAKAQDSLKYLGQPALGRLP